MTRNRTTLRNKIAKHLRESGVSFQIMDGRIIIMTTNGDYHYCAVDVICDSLDWYARKRPFTFFVVSPKTTKDGIKAIDKYMDECKAFRSRTKILGI